MSERIDTGGAAHPHTCPIDGTEWGMTLLDHFAGLAMQAIITHAKINSCGDFVANDCLLQHYKAPEFAAKTAYAFAAAMIAEKRNQGR